MKITKPWFLNSLFTNKSATVQTVEQLSKNKIDNWAITMPLVAGALRSAEYPSVQTPLREIITKLTADEVGALFDELVAGGIKDGNLEAVHRAVSLFTKEELATLLKDKIAQSKTSPQEAIEAFSLAEKEYSKLMTSSKDTLLEQGKTTFIKALRNFIDGCLISFHLVDMGNEISTPMEASEKYNAYSKLFAVPLVLFTALCTVTSVLTAFVVTGIIVSSLAFVTWAYIQWLQDSPNTIDPFVNLLEEAKEGNLDPVLAREAEIDAVLESLASSQNGHRSHPLLIGPSGVGKSEIVSGVAQRLALGNVPNGLKGKKLISINTTDLTDKTRRGMGEDALQRAIKKMDKKKDHYIVFLDEVHAAKENNELGTRLLTRLDGNTNGFPLVIAATTTMQYKKYIEPDIAFSRRFTKIDVKPMTKEQTVLTLREQNKIHAPEVSISEAMLEKIYDVSSKKMKGRAQPDASKELFTRVVAAVQHPKNPALNKHQQELANLSSKLHADPDLNRNQRLVQRIKTLKEKIDKLQESENEAHKLVETRTRLIRLKNAQTDFMFKTASKACDTKQEEYARTFLFWNYYLLPQVKAQIEEHERQHKASVPLKVDAALIERLA